MRHSSNLRVRKSRSPPPGKAVSMCSGRRLDGREKQLAWNTSMVWHSQKTCRRSSATSGGRFHRRPSMCSPMAVTRRIARPQSGHALSPFRPFSVSSA
jgi:hypothetical protein